MESNAWNGKVSSYLPLNLCEKRLSALFGRKSFVIPCILLSYINGLEAHLGASSPRAALQLCN